MIPLPLRNRAGKIVEFAWVDAQDAQRPELKDPTWRLKAGYAGCHQRLNGNRLNVYLHREVLGLAPGVGHAVEVDHMNGNKLDNRRSNLRSATRALNGQNLKLYRNTTSGFRGVDWYIRKQQWRARICVSGKFQTLGYYDSAYDAARAYSAAATTLHPYNARRDAA
jgi:hypothetical protein